MGKRHSDDQKGENTSPAKSSKSGNNTRKYTDHLTHLVTQNLITHLQQLKTLLIPIFSHLSLSPGDEFDTLEDPDATLPHGDDSFEMDEDDRQKPPAPPTREGHTQDDRAHRGPATQTPSTEASATPQATPQGSSQQGTPCPGFSALFATLPCLLYTSPSPRD